ncbi:MAG: GAF domain-containing protein [Deltaproteobacteria bacterium]|nr:GAF domain-containing protein [Deltaproteobacteria bacterium]
MKLHWAGATHHSEPHLDLPSSHFEDFVGVIQQLSHCRDLQSVMTVVRTAARKLTGADGATFVLRDNEHCFYADEDAISPLWKGQKFPLKACISGWAMLHQESVVIGDIYTDPRIPIDAYRPTFVKSLVMVPIRKASPIGAIGTYWATKRTPTSEEIATLQALADTTSVAMENLQLYSDLQNKISDLKTTNEELNRFAQMTAHDFREPLRIISTYTALLEAEAGDKLSAQEKEYIQFAENHAQRLHKLIENLTLYFNISATDKKFEKIHLQDAVQAAAEIINPLMSGSPQAKFTYAHLPHVHGNLPMLTQVFAHLFSNSIKFKSEKFPEIQISSRETEKDWIIEVKDNGMGIDKVDSQNIFDLIHRLHPQDKYPGAGIGLAICKKIISLHHGRIWVDSKLGQGSTFSIALPRFRFS